VYGHASRRLRPPATIFPPTGATAWTAWPGCRRGSLGRGCRRGPLGRGAGVDRRCGSRASPVGGTGGRSHPAGPPPEGDE